MKVVILAGGFGTRFAEKTSELPKPLIEIGGKPIIWHLMKTYAQQGFTDFVLALGYKGDQIQQFMAKNVPHDWNVSCVDTGLHTQTGGRIHRLADEIGQHPFMLTYADGLSNIDFCELLAFHKAHGKLATVTAVHPPPKYGWLEMDGAQVVSFQEKQVLTEVWISGGYFVLEPDVLNFIDDDDTSWEASPLQTLATQGELMAYQHEDFWRCMDTAQEHQILETMWSRGTPPWKTW